MRKLYNCVAAYIVKTAKDMLRPYHPESHYMRGKSNRG